MTRSLLDSIIGKDLVRKEAGTLAFVLVGVLLALVL